MYKSIIKEILTSIGRDDIQPHLVEAYLRLKYGCLDALDRKTFTKETKRIVKTIDKDPELAERLAETL